MSEDSKEMVKVRVLKSLAWHPFYGGFDDVINLPANRFEVLSAEGVVELFNPAPAVPAAPAEPAENAEEVEKKVDEHMAGLDALFDKQADNAAALAELAAQAEGAEAAGEAAAEAPAKKGKK